MLRAISNLCVVFVLFSTIVSTRVMAGVEAEPNNNFASAQMLAAGDLTVSGELAVSISGTPYGQQPGVLVPGGVVSHDFPVTAGEPYTALIDNSGDGADTTMQSLDESFIPIDSDDDSSPLGTGLGSALMLTGNPDGTVHLMVSGYDDFDFDGQSDGGGPHSQSGSYVLFLYQGSILGDVDVYAFTGLSAGQRYIAETFAGTSGSTPDTVLGWYDNLGALIETDDDSGEGTLSQLMLTVPADGTLFLGVTAFSDFGLVGQHGGSGSYALTLEAVPEPSGGALGVVGILVFVLGQRRRLALGRTKG